MSHAEAKHYDYADYMPRVLEDANLLGFGEFRSYSNIVSDYYGSGLYKMCDNIILDLDLTDSPVVADENAGEEFFINESSLVTELRYSFNDSLIGFSDDVRNYFGGIVGEFRNNIDENRTIPLDIEINGKYDTSIRRLKDLHGDDHD